ncbi:phage integrase family protein [Psychromonas ingrahamii 37]|uniref:Phage integrase family protein n=1 Tax=Psychromonas ingrahamii (strain DSM 17664 / CCUG 51855 / 37) TaxID=357804 RepID=A1SS01_PSYIN|nr:tyrosine-type recombinase/integrase [Psychromonas ingrahamii]ABM02266.1 phage integrase family protein [Psychromonas ingrahamii 37]
MTTKVIKFSAAALKSAEQDIAFNEFRDARYPLRLRLHKCRSKGSWYLVRSTHGKSKHEKIGSYPNIKLKDILANLSRNLIADTAEPESEFQTLGQLLKWYLARTEQNSQITKQRKTTIRWAITRHLLPLIDELPLNQITYAALDKHFFQPIQQKYAMTTAKNIWIILKQSVAQAVKLVLIKPDPISSFEFSDFIKVGKTAERPGLKYYQVAKLFIDAQAASVPARALVAIMLLHGTRLGETRQTKWSDICFKTDLWSIPGPITKTRTELNLPITPLVKKILTDYRNWQEQNGYTGVFVFPAPKGRSAISAYAANELIQEVSLNNWTSHQLRKFARTTWVDLKIDFLIAELLLNHKLTKVTAAYIHTDAVEAKSEALTVYHVWLAAEFSALNDIINDAIPARP